jgi:hypothetical protein
LLGEDGESGRRGVRPRGTREIGLEISHRHHVEIRRRVEIEQEVLVESAAEAEAIG